MSSVELADSGAGNAQRLGARLPDRIRNTPNLTSSPAPPAGVRRRSNRFDHSIRELYRMATKGDLCYLL